MEAIEQPVTCFGCGSALLAQPSSKTEQLGTVGTGRDGGAILTETIHIGWLYTWVCPVCTHPSTAYLWDNVGADQYPATPAQAGEGV